MVMLKFNIFVQNMADLFTKALFIVTFKKLVHNIGIRRLSGLKDATNKESCYTLYSFTLGLGFNPLDFPARVFNEAAFCSYYSYKD